MISPASWPAAQVSAGNGLAAGQAEAAGGDHVALNLAGAAGDLVRERGLVAALDPPLKRRPLRAGLKLAAEPQQIDRRLAEALVHLRAVHLRHRRLVVGDDPLRLLPGDAPRQQAGDVER